ncbi:MAG: hypothetical protein GVX78_02925 [Bacteroidetes bacterium]|jgi:hypothetical protein|nr:hypothetical protein [Bacteroidota bacterium]
MRLPLIKKLTDFVADNRDEDYLIETIETLEALSEVSSIQDEELDVIGELLSNLYGAVEVQKDIVSGTPRKEALNSFMKRVTGAIDQ